MAGLCSVQSVEWGIKYMVGSLGRWVEAVVVLIE